IYTSNINTDYGIGNNTSIGFDVLRNQSLSLFSGGGDVNISLCTNYKLSLFIKNLLLSYNKFSKVGMIDISCNFIDSKVLYSARNDITFLVNKIIDNFSDYDQSNSRYSENNDPNDIERSIFSKIENLIESNIFSKNNIMNSPASYSSECFKQHNIYPSFSCACFIGRDYLFSRMLLQ
ncbi:MAG TPA: hypothetical protein QKA14_03120, partial [Candidatus Megaira endosymbiont of Hartmannula sinica]|nr:hypothetical protein [Candidatus Megaera endosymbiont of Hartmannula sinica]